MAEQHDLFDATHVEYHKYKGYTDLNVTSEDYAAVERSGYASGFRVGAGVTVLLAIVFDIVVVAVGLAFFR